jgi:hypothetical protein
MPFLGTMSRLEYRKWAIYQVQARGSIWWDMVFPKKLAG